MPSTSAPSATEQAWELTSDWSEVVRYLEAAYPQEGCGVILRASSDGARRVRFMPNAYDRHHAIDPVRFPHTSRNAYLFEPREWLAVLMEADARGEQITCVFHSHVNGIANFSEEDRAQAAPAGPPVLPGTSYLVVAVVAGRATEARLFRWVDGDFLDHPVPLPT